MFFFKLVYEENILALKRFLNFNQYMAPLYCEQKFFWVDSWTLDLVNKVKFRKTYSDVLKLLKLRIAYKILFTKPSRSPISYEKSRIPFVGLFIVQFLFRSIPFYLVRFRSVLNIYREGK